MADENLNSAQGAGLPEAAFKGLQEPFGVFKPTALQAFIISLVQKNPLFRAAVRTRANRLLQYIKKGAVDHTLYGLKFRFFPGENAGDRKALLTPNGFDRDECDLIVKHLAQDGVFLDIGSNIGAYTFNIAARRGDARILAFEPTPRVYAKLSYNLMINELQDRVTAYNIALADKKGEMRFNSERESLVLGEGDMTVQTDTLLNVLNEQNITAIGALKIDVEGAEDSVLRPFFEAADKSLWPELVIIEHAFPEQWNWNCISFLETNGYSQIWRGGLNTVYQYNDGQG